MSRTALKLHVLPAENRKSNLHSPPQRSAHALRRAFHVDRRMNSTSSPRAASCSCAPPPPHMTYYLFPFSSAIKVHDGILPASQASVYELSGSVGPRSLPRQLACATDLQHQRVEQVSCVPTPRVELQPGQNEGRHGAAAAGDAPSGVTP